MTLILTLTLTLAQLVVLNSTLFFDLVCYNFWRPPSHPLTSLCSTSLGDEHATCSSLVIPARHPHSHEKPVGIQLELGLGLG